MVKQSDTGNGSITGRMKINGFDCEASLSSEGTLTWRGKKGVGRLSIESEALGFVVEHGFKIRVRSFVGDSSVAEVNVTCGKSGSPVGKRSMKDYVLEMDSDHMVHLWSQKLDHCFNSLDRPKRLFILINPFGGKKCARKIFMNEIKPLLETASILYTVEETRYQLHAQEISYKLELQKYDGIVCVSGDGLLVEMVNGLLQREDWNSAIKVPIGIIPAGTGNGMAKSLLDAAGETFSVQNAAFSIIRGHKRSLDVTTVMQGSTKFFSVLMLTWGLIADIDIESEKYRWMGSARLDFYVLLRIINLRRYNGRVEFIPAPGYESFGEPLDANNDPEVVAQLLSKNDNEKGQLGYQGPSSIGYDKVEWRFIEGPFISVWLNNIPWSGEDIMLAPEAKFSDGYLDVVITKDCSRSTMLKLMLQMSDGSHVESPYVMYFKAISSIRTLYAYTIETLAKYSFATSLQATLCYGILISIVQGLGLGFTYGIVICSCALQLWVEEGSLSLKGMLMVVRL